MWPPRHRPFGEERCRACQGVVEDGIVNSVPRRQTAHPFVCIGDWQNVCMYVW